MRVIINENKLVGIIQKVINSEINILQDLKESGVEIPDDISISTWDNIETIRKLTVSDITETKFKITPVIYYNVIIDVVYDSVTGVDIVDILWDLQHEVMKTLGLSGVISFKLGEERNLYKEYGQW
jgi:hypothetical protein